MSGQGQENLKELVERFFEAGQVRDCLEDFQKAEQALQRYPAPQPDDMLIANIKAEIAMRLPARRALLSRRRLWETVGMAAAITIMVFFGARMSQRATQPHRLYASLLPTAIWDSSNLAADDAELAVYTAEIEQIRSEVVALESGENTVDPDSAVDELEMELVQISSDFWKG